MFYPTRSESHDTFDDYPCIGVDVTRHLLPPTTAGVYSRTAFRRNEADEYRHNEERVTLFAPPEAGEPISSEETARQSVISELIQHESDYTQDLKFISDQFIEPLMQSVSITTNGRGPGSIAKAVFSNWKTLHANHEEMFAALSERQRSQDSRVTSEAGLIVGCEFCSIRLRARTIH